MKSFSHRTLAVSAVLTALVATTGLLMAGPLNPPGGAVSSTMKTLAEVEPRIAINATNTPGDAGSMFKITSPGSYYVTSNVLVAPGKVGIKIEADEVTVDLNGYRVGGFNGSLDGIGVAGTARRAITVRNGTVYSCGGVGINFQLGVGDSWVKGGRVLDVTTSSCGGDGVALGEDGIGERINSVYNGVDGISCRIGCTLSHCTASENTRMGMYADFECTVSECMVNENGDDGIAAHSAVNIINCTATYNAGTGIRVSDSSRIEGCLLWQNEEGGIKASYGNQILNNECQSNGISNNAAGINAYLLNRLEGNHCMGSAYGIRATGSQNVIVSNTCSSNTMNWSIVPDNYYGPIINRVGVAASAVAGDSAAGSLGTTDPHANFTH